MKSRSVIIFFFINNLISLKKKKYIFFKLVNIIYFTKHIFLLIIYHITKDFNLMYNKYNIGILKDSINK